MALKAQPARVVCAAAVGVTIAMFSAVTPSLARTAQAPRAAVQVSKARAPLGLKVVSAVRGSNFAWAAGETGNFGTSFLVSFNGKQWSAAHVKLAPTTSLTAVAAVSKTAVWLAGVIGGPFFGTRERPFLALYSGGALHAVSLQAFHATQINAISLVTAKSVWAAGQSRVSKSQTEPLALHYNGHAWHQFSFTSKEAGLSLVSVSANSSKTIWATTADNAGDSEVVKFTGRRWSVSLSAPPAIQLEAIVAASSSDAWTVGSVVNGESGGYSAHWNGKTWTAVATPKLTVDLGGLTMQGSKAWAAGEIFLKNKPDRAVPEMLFSAGHGWTSQRVPDPGVSSSPENQSRFTAISAASAHFLIVVGQNGTTCGTGSGFADINTGKAWQAAALPPRFTAPAGLVPACGG